jgi:hypothetical protein
MTNKESVEEGVDTFASHLSCPITAVGSEVDTYVLRTSTSRQCENSGSVSFGWARWRPSGLGSRLAAMHSLCHAT